MDNPCRHEIGAQSVVVAVVMKFKEHVFFPLEQINWYLTKLERTWRDCPVPASWVGPQEGGSIFVFLFVYTVIVHIFQFLYIYICLVKYLMYMHFIIYHMGV